MSDAAARRRQRILQAAGNRMAAVSGLAGGPVDGEEGEQAAGQQAEAGAGAEAPGVVAGDGAAAAAAAAPGVGSSGGSNRARMRRLQSRKIAGLEGASDWARVCRVHRVICPRCCIPMVMMPLTHHACALIGTRLNAGAASTASFSTTTAAEPEKEEEAAAVAPGGDEAQGPEPEPEAPATENKETAAAQVGSTTSSTSTSAPSSMELPSAGPALTTGGNTLRRRFRASKSSLGGDEDLGLGAKDGGGDAGG